MSGRSAKEITHPVHVREQRQGIHPSSSCEGAAPRKSPIQFIRGRSAKEFTHPDHARAQRQGIHPPTPKSKIIKSNLSMRKKPATSMSIVKVQNGAANVEGSPQV